MRKEKSFVVRYSGLRTGGCDGRFVCLYLSLEMTMDQAIFEESRSGRQRDSRQLASFYMCFCSCLFVFSPGGSERKKWFGIIAKRAGKRVCLRMEGKNYQKGAGWN